ncbi:MAG TPA: adenylate/guanylate cyclase domain-containing protein [Marmoricola sp.]
MRLRVVRWLYRRLGRQSWLVLAVTQGSAAAFVAVVTVLLSATYFDPPRNRALVVALIGAAASAAVVAVVAYEQRAILERLHTWREAPEHDPAETVTLWNQVVSETWERFRSRSGKINVCAVLAATVAAATLWNIGWAGWGAMILACVVPVGYAVVVSYSISELLTRPLAEEVAAELPDEFVLEPSRLTVVRRLKIALPAYTSVAAMGAASLLPHRNGAAALAIAAGISIAIGVGLSAELTTLLGDALTEPVRRLRDQVMRVRDGDFAARTPVLSSDELGELAHEVNGMTRGLVEREQIREAFGTYADKGVVEVIMSGAFPPEGLEMTVSILFCDVRGFTSYAEQATAPQVIATLNEMFSAIVPIVERHGGHIDKFMGDGLLAVFGAPDPLPDHADRAVAAACEIVTAVRLGDTGLTVGAGVNTGPVVAGPIGGAGRLNFSVIGDVVNVAARVESATRETGDDVLLTDATRRALQHPPTLVSRGGRELKGKAEPVELFALA